MRMRKMLIKNIRVKRPKIILYITIQHIFLIWKILNLIIIIRK